MKSTPQKKRMLALVLPCLFAGPVLFAPAAQAAGQLVISQAYGGGGNSGAILKNDFVELFNRGDAPASLSGLSLQYASTAGTTWNNKLVLPAALLQPGQYFLIQLAAGTGGSVSLPTPDATGTIAMSATAGKLALVNGTADLPTGTVCPAANVIDILGYGTSTNCSETGPMVALSNTTAGLRAAAGCTDSNNNAADFATGVPAPRNSASPLNNCGGASVNAPIATTCPALSLSAGTAGSVAISASDADSTVNDIVTIGALPAGITLDAVSAAAGDGASATARVSVAAGTATGNYPIGIRFSNNEAQSADCTVDITIATAAAITPIPQIQGSGDVSPKAGQTVTTEGIVTAVFPGLSGFYLQDETGDGDVSTSDGVFVFAPALTTVQTGQKLRLNATVSEFNTVTELLSPTAVQVLGSGYTVAPTDVVLPEAVEGDLERYEGMLVRIVTPLTVSQNYFQGRYGQVTLSAEGRMEIPTNRYPAGTPEAIALRDANARRRIVLDDGSSAQNPNPIPFIGTGNTLRAGDTVAGLTGVIDHGLVTASNPGPRDYKLHPAVTPVFSRDNPRTAVPAAVGGNVRVASFNVLNYFTTLDQAGSSCFPSGTVSDCRGANSAAEFARQRDKIVSALRAIDADVVGLMEIENNGQVAVQNLVTALNSAYGASVYAAVGLPAGGTGTDAIRVAMIYKPGRVSPVSAALSDTNPVHNRPPLAQTFAVASGERFSVVVNHFKSKSCGSPTGANVDQGDGQGCWNALRVSQANALVTFVQTLSATSGSGDVLMIGDLNSYGKEDPVNALTGAGMINLAAGIALPYTYTFDGESGQLDHALATGSLAARVSGFTQWHINTDEPSVIDYNTEFKPQDLYAPTPYRASDHDPVVIGLSLLHPVNGTAGRDVLGGTPGDDVITGGEGADVLSGGAGSDLFVYRSLRDGIDTITDFVPGTDRLDLSALLASLGISRAVARSGGYVQLVDTNSGVSVQIDADGSAGAGVLRPLVTLRGRTAAQIDFARDLGL